MVDIKTKTVRQPRQLDQQVDSSPVRGFVSQAAGITSNAIELAELQAQLAKEDASEAIQMAIKPIFVIAVCLVLLLASLPVVLFAMAGFLARYSEMSLEIAQLIVGCSATLLSIVGVLVAIRYLKTSLTSFRRSAEEFKQNLEWFKSIFRSTNTH